MAQSLKETASSLSPTGECTGRLNVDLVMSLVQCHVDGLVTVCVFVWCVHVCVCVQPVYILYICIRT